MAPSRDYYADLELPPTADIQDVKKQFRKMALKYHPDRNPGREQEVNAKFQIIQSAHEILSDPQKKTKYDATFSRSSRFPGPSGVKGNPWQGVSQQFPTPPRRTPAARNSTSGAQRWQDRFSNGVPPTAKQRGAADANFKRDAGFASEYMRNSTGHTPQRETRQPPPPPPRTKTAKQRAEAAFGSRRSGYYPHAATGGDEPAAKGPFHTYWTDSTRRQSPKPPPRPPEQTKIPEPLSQFRAKDGLGGSRQSTPYMSHGGEKTNPFEGISLDRMRSTKITKENDSAAQSEASTPARPAKHARSPEGGAKSHETPQKEASVTTEAAAHASLGPDTRNEIVLTQPQPMWKVPQSSNNVFLQLGELSSTMTPSVSELNERSRSRLAPSGDQELSMDSMSRFEMRQRFLLDCLISSKRAGEVPEEEALYDAPAVSRIGLTRSADHNSHDSFNFPTAHPSYKSASFTSESVQFPSVNLDDINTKFVNGDDEQKWRFNASTPEAPERSPGSSKPRSRKPPQPRPSFTQRSESDSSQPAMETPPGKFNADGWSNQFGPKTFVPRPTHSSSTSPTRSSRTNSRNVNNARPTVRNAAVLDSSSDEEPLQWPGRNAQSRSNAGESPQAMDLDPPAFTPPGPPQASNARNTPVEPTRPEWRSGDPVAKAPDVVTGGRQPTAANAVAQGSEDSEEFRASFADLNVAPLAPKVSGLKSLLDLKDNLPFKSKASEQLPFTAPKIQPLHVPEPPVAPKAPLITRPGQQPQLEQAAWDRYTADFATYLDKWELFNHKVVDHFTTRAAHIARIRASKGFEFVSAGSDEGVKEYFIWIQQDNGVRRKWLLACENHAAQASNFIAMKERME